MAGGRTSSGIGVTARLWGVILLIVPVLFVGSTPTAAYAAADIVSGAVYLGASNTSPVRARQERCWSLPSVLLAALNSAEAS